MCGNGRNKGVPESKAGSLPEPGSLAAVVEAPLRHLCRPLTGLLPIARSLARGAAAMAVPHLPEPHWQLAGKPLTAGCTSSADAAAAAAIAAAFATTKSGSQEARCDWSMCTQVSGQPLDVQHRL